MLRRGSGLTPKRNDVTQEVGWMVSLSGSEELDSELLACDHFEEGAAVADWFCYTKPLDQGDREISIREQQTGALVYRFVSCGSNT